jgi:hypothetical protein
MFATNTKWNKNSHLSELRFENMLNPDSTYDLFSSDELLKFVLTADFKTIKRDISESRKYHEANITYFSKDKELLSIKTKIKTRGQIRRNINICNFPPLKLKLDTIDIQGTIFSGNKKMKLVTHCQTASNYYEDYIILEYLVYKIYQIISEESFNVRLAKINYTDINDKTDNFEKFGLLIEDDDKLASRLNGIILDRKNVHPNLTVKNKMNRLAIFQYMIGNMDWSVKALHNIKILSIADSPPIAIPYDFDYSGFINTKYAVPPEHLNLNSVKMRYYNGYCRTIDELNENLNYFNVKKDEILSTISDCKYLNEKTKKQKLKYIEEFYEIINDQKKVTKNIFDNCRK